MINRVLIRIKVVQLLYSYLLTQSEFKIESLPENPSRDKKYAYSLYLIGSVDFDGWVIHLICLDGEGWFVYDGRKFTVRRNDVVIITQPRKVTEIGQSDGLSVEIIAAPGEFLNIQGL